MQSRDVGFPPRATMATVATAILLVTLMLGIVVSRPPSAGPSPGEHALGPATTSSSMPLNTPPGGVRAPLPGAPRQVTGPSLGAPVGTGPDGLAFSSKTTDVYVANFGSSNVSLLSGATGLPVGSISGVTSPSAALFDPANLDVLVAEETSNSVAVIGPANTVSSTVHVGKSPIALAFDSASGTAYVSNGGSTNLTAITSAGALGTPLALSSSPAGVAYDSQNGDLYVALPSLNLLQVVNPTSGKIVANVTTGLDPYGVAVDVTASASTALVTDDFAGNVTLVNGTTNAVTKTVTVGSDPRGILFDPANGNSYAAVSGTNQVSILSGGLLGWLSSGESPAAVGLDNATDELYVANYDSNTVSSFSLAASTTVTFSETGLPAATPWNVTLGTVVHASTATSLTFTEPSATYPYTVGGVLGYAPLPPSGTVMLSGTPQTVPIVYNMTFPVKITEQGLPTGTRWWVTLGHTNTSLSSSSVTVLAVNGSYTYQAESPVANGSWERFVLTPDFGMVLVNGEPASVTLRYAAQYSLAISVNPASEGSSSTLSGWYDASSTVNLTASPLSGFAFYGWVGTGPGAYSGTANPYALDLIGSVNETANFGAILKYAVTFSENGLPAKTSWSVTVAGQGPPVLSTGGSITFQLANATYSYSVASPIPTSTGVEYQASPASANVTVHGATPVDVPYSTFYQVTVNANPPTGGKASPATGWWGAGAKVALNETPATGCIFSHWTGTGNGSYSGSSPAPTVQAEGPIAEQAFFLPLFTITFKELGLPPGSSWSVTLNGSTQSGTGHAFNFSEPAGSYAYSVAAPSGYAAAPSAGRVTLSDAGTTLTTQFTVITKAKSGLLGLSTLQWVAFIAVAAIVVVVAALFAFRGKRLGGEEPAPPEPGETPNREPEPPEKGAEDQPYEIISPNKEE